MKKNSPYTTYNEDMSTKLLHKNNINNFKAIFRSF